MALIAGSSSNRAGAATNASADGGDCVCGHHATQGPQLGTASSNFKLLSQKSLLLQRWHDQVHGVRQHAPRCHLHCSIKPPLQQSHTLSHRPCLLPLLPLLPQTSRRAKVRPCGCLLTVNVAFGKRQPEDHDAHVQRQVALQGRQFSFLWINSVAK